MQSRAPMKLKALLLATLILTPAIASSDSTNKTDQKQSDRSTPDKSKQAQVDSADMKLVSHGKHVNDMEIAMGKLAKTNGTAAVKKYGDMLVKDHTKNNTQLTALMKKKGVTTIPDEVPETEAEKTEHKQMMDDMAKLKTLKGVDFDRQFLTMMIAGHDREVLRFKSGADTAKDKDIAKHLTNTVPVIQNHADKARELQTKAVSMQ